MPDPRPCCILGVCCPPGGEAQKADLKTWLMEKLFATDMPGKLYGPPSEDSGGALVDAWLDELFAGAESA